MSTDRFCFEGFLPAKTVARQRVLETLNSETRTMVFYEAPHRITETIAAMGKAFGQERWVMIAREITKHYETFWQGSLAEATSALEKNEITQRGEFVVILDGIGEKPEFYDEATLMRTLLLELPPGKAAKVAHQLTGVSKKVFYEIALKEKT
jgi:16S rRNA (cytidine1402-2'-O)-methyltransferase